MTDVTRWLPHAYTASGTILGLMAILAVTEGDLRSAFLWLFAAAAVDGTDGWLARRCRVAERVRSVDGARLDDIVDYVTYVFVPAYLIHQTDLLPDAAALAVTSTMLLASAYGFARTDAKTSDYFFTGFPSYWNLVALYLYLGRLPSWANAIVIVVLSFLVFVPTAYVYPSRTPILRRTTLAFASLWGAALLAMIWRLPERSGTWTVVSLSFPAYYAGLSAVLHGRRTTGITSTGPTGA